MSQRDQAAKSQDKTTEKPAQPEGEQKQAAPVLLQRAYAAPDTLTPNDVKHLQRKVGNRATAQILSLARPVQRKAILGRACAPLVSEADTVEEQVDRSASNTLVQAEKAAAQVVPAARRQFVVQRQTEIAPTPAAPVITTGRTFALQRRYSGGVLDYEQLKKDKKGGDAVPTISGFTKKGFGTGLSDLIKGMYTLIMRDDVTLDQLRTQLGLVRNAFVADKQTIQDADSATPQQKERAGTVFDKWIKVVDDNLAHLNTPLGGTITADKLIKELRRAYNDQGGIKPGDDLPEVADMLEVRFQNRQNKEREASESERNARVTEHYEENVGAAVLEKVQDLEFLASVLPQVHAAFQAPDLPQKFKDLAEPLIIQAVAEEKGFDEISSEVQRVAKTADPKPKLGVYAAKFFTMAQAAARTASDQAIAPVAAPAKDAATLAQEFLDSREIYKIAADAMPKQDRIAFSAALRKVRIIKQLLTPDEVPEHEVVVAAWKGDRNLQDDVRSEKENNRCGPRSLEAMRRKAAEANDFFKRFVAPRFPVYASATHRQGTRQTVAEPAGAQGVPRLPDRSICPRGAERRHIDHRA
ncbi:MAG: hypothetical protein R2856_25515 [Caldilineaceae bacterium]